MPVPGHSYLNSSVSLFGRNVGCVFAGICVCFMWVLFLFFDVFFVARQSPTIAYTLLDE